MFPKAPNIHSINTVIKYYEYIVQVHHFNVASFWETSIPTILKATQVSKAAGLGSLSGCFPKDGAKYLVKPISGLCNLSISFENFPDLCKVTRIKPLYKRRFFNSVL